MRSGALAHSSAWRGPARGAGKDEKHLCLDDMQMHDSNDWVILSPPRAPGRPTTLEAPHHSAALPTGVADKSSICFAGRSNSPPQPVRRQQSPALQIKRPLSMSSADSESARDAVGGAVLAKSEARDQRAVLSGFLGDASAVYVYQWAFMAAFALCCMHVQVATR